MEANGRCLTTAHSVLFPTVLQCNSLVFGVSPSPDLVGKHKVKDPIAMTPLKGSNVSCLWQAFQDHMFSPRSVFQICSTRVFVPNSRRPAKPQRRPSGVATDLTDGAGSEAVRWPRVFRSGQRGQTFPWWFGQTGPARSCPKGSMVLRTQMAKHKNQREASHFGSG